MADDESSSFDLGGLRTLNTLTQSLTKAAQAFGKSITSAFASGIVEGRRFEDVLRSIGASLTQSLLKSALKPLQSTISNWLGSGVNSLAGLFSGGMGAVVPRRSPSSPMAASLPRPPISRWAAGSG